MSNCRLAAVRQPSYTSYWTVGTESSVQVTVVEACRSTYNSIYDSALVLLLMTRENYGVSERTYDRT